MNFYRLLAPLTYKFVTNVGGMSRSIFFVYHNMSYISYWLHCYAKFVKKKIIQSGSDPTCC
jgi:hypothetical protein